MHRKSYCLLDGFSLIGAGWRCWSYISHANSIWAYQFHIACLRPIAFMHSMIFLPIECLERTYMTIDNSFPFLFSIQYYLRRKAQLTSSSTPFICLFFRQKISCVFLSFLALWMWGYTLLQHFLALSLLFYWLGNECQSCSLIVQDLPKLNRCTELLSMNEELKQARKVFESDEEKLRKVFEADEETQHRQSNMLVF